MTPLVETSIEDHVALCRLNRPEARNALSPELMADLAGQLARFDADTEVRCIVIAGSDEVFAAGADIGALAERQFHEALFHPAAVVLAAGRRDAGRRWSPRSPASPSAAAASWR